MTGSRILLYFEISNFFNSGLENKTIENENRILTKNISP